MVDSHQYFLFPPIALLTAVYWPLLGRREYIKILWLACMVSYAVGQAKLCVGYHLYYSLGQRKSSFQL